jgi:CxxC motif-containing protein (DUF1111 family)
VTRLAFLLLAALGVGFSAGRGVPDTPSSGGSATVNDATRDAFSQPASWLDAAGMRRFFVGNSLFNQAWVSAPSSASERDGLGPMFNARSCSGCHLKDGRGGPPEPGQPLATMLLRIGTGALAPDGAPLGDPRYGDQLQGLALPGVAAEANAFVEYEELPGRFDDGEPYTLRRPRYRLERQGYGPLAPGARVSPRVAPAMIGLGLLEGVPETELLRASDPEDVDGDGISGRPSWVAVAGRGELALGRFGWKAEQPSVRQQVAGALAGDLGLTTSLFPNENHTAQQLPGRTLPGGGFPEVDDAALAALTLYARSLAVPARRNVDEPRVQLGAELFDAIGCARCHTPRLVTGPLPDLPQVPREPILPYTDLLLHDLGEALSDERPAFTATGREWRTPPLWGLGLLRTVSGHTFLLHDGRARGAAEAILWHGGEADAARRAFALLPRSERLALLAFLESL